MHADSSASKQLSFTELHPRAAPGRELRLHSTSGGEPVRDEGPQHCQSNVM